MEMEINERCLEAFHLHFDFSAVSGLGQINRRELYPPRLNLHTLLHKLLGRQAGNIGSHRTRPCICYLCYALHPAAEAVWKKLHSGRAVITLTSAQTAQPSKWPRSILDPAKRLRQIEVCLPMQL